MFNLTSSENVRCNGAVNSVPKTTGRTNNHRSSINSIISNSTKCIDRTIVSDSRVKHQQESSSINDPYKFNEFETYVARNENSDEDKNSLNNKKHYLNDRVNNSTSTKNVYNLVFNHLKTTCEVQQNNDTSSKTMNKLQAQIARNKVNVKHKKDVSCTALPKDSFNLIKNESDINKSSIIGVSDSNNGKNPRIAPGGKPIPQHLKTRRTNLKTTHHETLQRIRKKRVWHAPPYQAGGTLSDMFSMSDTDSDTTGDDDVDVTIGNLLNSEMTDVALLMDDSMMGMMGMDRDRELRIQRSQQRLHRMLIQRQEQFSNKTTTNTYRTINLISAMQTTHQQCSQIANVILQHHSKFRDRLQLRSSNSGLIPPRQCSYDGDGAPCKQIALPCTRHCGRHIMHNSDQLLYDYCTAKFADNTQCCIPVFDLNHELPLCIEHARKRDNYNKMCQVVKPKKPRKKVKPSAMIRPQKRSKKRKRPTSKSSSSNSNSNNSNSDRHTSNKLEHMKHNTSSTHQNNISAELTVGETSSACESSDDLGLGSLAENSDINSQNHFGADEPDDDMVAQVLGVGEELPLELAGPPDSIVNQASKLLEETDLTTVFSQIPPDAFNDLFAIDRNGVYEPTREETEELERALEAVNQDVKSLEKMSQTQGILDSLLDEHALVESLAQMPDVFPNLNGFSVNSVNVAPATPAPVSSTTISTSRPIHGLDNIISVQPPPTHMPSLS